MKRSRLLKELDKITSVYESDSLTGDQKNDNPVENAVTHQELNDLSVGSRCRFRYSDGRWYNGFVEGFEGAGSVRISFLNPTSEKMLVRYPSVSPHLVILLSGLWKLPFIVEP